MRLFKFIPCFVNQFPPTRWKQGGWKVLLFFMIYFCFVSHVPIYAQEASKTILKLSISELSKLAIENNFDIQIYKLDKSISEKDILKAEAVYDTDLDFNYDYTEDKLNRSSVIFGKRVTTVSQNAGITKQIPSGTVLSLGISHAREVNNSAFSTTNPVHESEIGLSIIQPIAKNAWGILDRYNIKITELDIENTSYTSIDKIENELADTQKAYWDLVFREQQLLVTKDIHRIARELYEQNTRNFDLGLVEAPEFCSTEANLKEKEQEVVLSEDLINRAINKIRLKLALEKDVKIITTDNFTSEKLELSFEELFRTALETRRDYRTAKNDVKKLNLEIEMKKNSLLPQIDIVASLKRNGVDKKFINSVREISSEEFPEYSAGVVFSMPLELSAETADHTQKVLEKAKALITLKKTECEIFVNVHDAYIHLISTYDSAGLLKDAMELQKKKYEGEADRFRKGRSDTDRFIRYQDDYLRARLVYLKILYEYEVAIIDLNLVMNRLFNEA